MHTCGREDVPMGQTTHEHGFIGSLRPYSALREENFLQVMQAIIALRPHLAGERAWEVRLVEALWMLGVTTQQWGIDPSGLLQRNRLLTAEETKRLRLWVTCIDIAVSRLMRNGDPADGMTYYLEETGQIEIDDDR